MRNMTSRNWTALVPALVAVLFAGCNTYAPRPVMMAKNHPVLGVWEYEADGQMHRREFTPDGKCIMYRGRPRLDKNGKAIEYSDDGEAMYVCDFTVISGRTVIVVKIDRRKHKLPYEVLVDGRLNVEDRHIATRVR